MKKTVLFFIAPLFIFAKVHYAKVEPYESVTLKSSVSGLVVDADLDAEGMVVDSKMVIHLDDALDKVNLEDSKSGLKLLEEMHDINNEVAAALKKTLSRQQNHFRRMNSLSTISRTQKDAAYSSFVSAKTQYMGTKEKVVSLKKQILDMKYKIAQLEDIIKKKSIILNNKYLYKLIVRKGDFVAPGSPLAKIKDASRAKLVLFLDTEELKDLESKKVYIDDKETKYKVDKVWNVADEKYISSYRAEIYMPAPKGSFSKLVKIELK